MIYGYGIEGTYDDKENFFFSIFPAAGFAREGGLWSLQFTWLNLMIVLFVGKGDENGEG